MKKVEKSVILIVDDKQKNLFAFEQLLAGADRNIVIAATGKEALKIVLHSVIDLIILDVQMPDMDGFEVAQILKSNRRTRDIPIIFATAEKKEHGAVMKGFEEGAIDYLFKPIDPDIVRAKVNVLLKLQQQKKELQETNASLEQCALLINNSADIIGIIDAGTLRIEQMNSAFTDILGYPLEETKDVPVTFFLSKEDQKVFLDLSKRSESLLSFDSRIFAKDRSIKWLQWKIVARNLKWYVNARDITDVKQVEKIRNYLATVVKQSSDAIYIHNSDGAIISWNDGAERIYGYSEDEALKMKIWNIIPGYLLSEREELMLRILRGERIKSVETKRITRHGRLVDVLFSASIITDPGSGINSVAITERDITLQKQADEEIKKLHDELRENVAQLETTNKELESFSYTISHDLRAPLRAINGFAQILDEDYAANLDSEAARLLRNIQGNARRMGMLIDDLLAFSKLGRKGINKTRVHMQSVVQHVVDDLRPTTTAEILIDTLPDCQADLSLLTQVWVNLASNALKYSAKKEFPSVRIGASESDEEVVFHVADNGAGFDMRYADKLFGVFERLHSAEEFEGTGIGLAIVKRIVLRHGGRVWAEAKPGEGATFYFSLNK